MCTSVNYRANFAIQDSLIMIFSFVGELLSIFCINVLRLDEAQKQTLLSFSNERCVEKNC